MSFFRLHLATAHFGVGLVLLLQACTSKKPGPAQPSAPEVLVTAVQQGNVPLYNEFVGSLDGSVNAGIQARVQGYLTSQAYKEGTVVHKGDVLFEIDPRPFAAAVAQAKAALAQAQASERQAMLTAQRNADLFKTRAVSEADRDNALQAHEASKALVDAQRAAMETAQLNLDFTKITAPVDGIAGLARAQIGDLVGPTTGLLTTVSTVDPIKAYFTASEQTFVEYQKRYADVAQRAAHEQQLEWELVLSDGSTFPHKGELFATDREIDVRTGAIRVAAVFPNPGNELRPGQFVRVRVRTEVQKDALLVPQRAVVELQGMAQAAVVGEDNKVSMRTVKVGDRVGTMWLITAGLKAGERVVVEGTQKVREGATVVPKPWIPAPPPVTTAAGK